MHKITENQLNQDIHTLYHDGFTAGLKEARLRESGEYHTSEFHRQQSYNVRSFYKKYRELACGNYSAIDPDIADYVSLLLNCADKVTRGNKDAYEIETRILKIIVERKEG